MKLSFAKRRFLILGNGSIARAFLPMLRQTVDIRDEHICVLSADEGRGVEAGGIQHIRAKLEPETFQDVLSELLCAGDCIVNLTGGVSARDLVAFSLCHGIDYIDTSNERWEFGATHDDSADFAQQWDLMISDREHLPKKATALVSHGANPGLVSHFAKQAVMDLALSEDCLVKTLEGSIDWSKTAQALNVSALHISEEDTQIAPKSAVPMARNTWCLEGLLEECHSAPCFALGSTETARNHFQVRRDRVYDVSWRYGAAKFCNIRSWLPSVGEFEACITPHEETFSIAELFTSETGEHRYQPTVLFAYRPCAEARSLLSMPQNNAEELPSKVMTDEITQGYDELGVLVLREASDSVYWFGSTLDIDAARGLVSGTNATSIQVAAGVLGGLVWLLENPCRGLFSAEHCNHERVLEIARPWLGTLKGASGRWALAPKDTAFLMGLESDRSREVKTPLPALENRL